ncbi:MAG: hypothetical protein LBD67_05020 [Candidatus Accumulibacter sp.]|nr:hypothetical protein [Accumulibacter sp.]
MPPSSGSGRGRANGLERCSSTTPISVRAEPVEVGTDAPPFPSMFFESFFNPYPSTSFLRQAQDGAG